MSVRLGEILVKESLITQDQLQKALEFQRANGGKLGSCLTKMGFITDDDITGVLSRQYGVPSINLKYYEIDPTVIKLIPQDTALRYQVVPLSRVGSVLTIAMTDPTNVFAMDDIKFMTGFNVEPVVASESAIGEAISRFYGSGGNNAEEISNLMKDLVDEDQELELAAEESEMDAASLEKAAEEAPIIKLVNLILTDSVKRGASDIHVEPYETELRNWTISLSRDVRRLRNSVGVPSAEGPCFRNPFNSISAARGVKNDRWLEMASTAATRSRSASDFIMYARAPASTMSWTS